jgi:acetyltransferase EpsM
MKKVLMIGGRNKAKMLLNMFNNDDVNLLKKLRFIGIYDEKLIKPFFKSKIKFFNKKKDLNILIKQADYFLLAIGNNIIRKKYTEFFDKYNIKALTVISKKAIIDKGVKIGEGSQIMPGAVIRSDSEIGKHTIINTNCSIDHDCIIEKYAHVMGAAALAGSVTVGEASNIGTNATVLPEIKIGKNSFVGAGSLVNKNVSNNLVVAGSPCKILKKINLIKT